MQSLYTTKTLITDITLNDHEAIHLIRTNDIVNKYIGRDSNSTMEKTETFIRDRIADVKSNKAYYWVIKLKESNVTIGTICLYNINEHRTEAEIGYELLPEYHGKGLMSEALKEIVRHGFEDLGFESFIAFPSKDNLASIKLLHKLHFTYDVNAELVDGDFIEFKRFNVTQ